MHVVLTLRQLSYVLDVAGALLDLLLERLTRVPSQVVEWSSTRAAVPAEGAVMAVPDREQTTQSHVGDGHVVVAYLELFGEL